MCGIVGFTTPGQDPAAAKQIVQGMADLIRHRGPDGEGCYADGTAALGHRRLSVIDLAGGGQPMLNEDGTLVVVFNGEIYNYKTLRARLQQRGHTFATDSDTEVLLHGYEEWGRDLPCRLRGMFAFAVWDRTCGTLFCARDLFGIKPLCYYKKGETLLFASEIKAFLAHPAFEKRLNEARLPDWLSMEYLPDAETLFTGVYELPPAHTLTWQAGRVTLARYAAPRFRAKRGRSLRAWAREIGDAVAESADAHRIADVEVGCFLSGGVDSSLITCEMARRQPAVQCFSVGYAEEAYSELPAARAAAQALGVPLTETTVTAEDFFAANRAIQWYLDEPMPNPAEVPLYFLCKAARQRVKVVLSGEGADELFGGYNIYRDPFTARWYDRLPPWLRAGLGAAASLLPPARGVNFLVRRGMSLEERYFGPTALFNERAGGLRRGRRPDVFDRGYLGRHRGTGPRDPDAAGGSKFVAGRGHPAQGRQDEHGAQFGAAGAVFGPGGLGAGCRAARCRQGRRAHDENCPAPGRGTHAARRQRRAQKARLSCAGAGLAAAGALHQPGAGRVQPPGSGGVL